VVFRSGLGLCRRTVASDPDNAAVKRQSSIRAGIFRFCNSREPGATAECQRCACGKNCIGLVGVESGADKGTQRLWIGRSKSNLL